MLRDYSYYKMTRGMCKHCRQIVNARIFEKDGSVFQENLCHTCGPTMTLVAEDRDWYFQYVNFPIQSPPKTSVHTAGRNGCPFDCGICEWHESGPNLPVFSITNDCNLRCPICFTYNRTDRKYYMSVEEMRKTVNFLLANKDAYDLINITGGEPTLHPQLLELLKVARHERIGRITLNSNGIRLAQDEDLVRALKDLGVYVILSLDTLDAHRSLQIHGRDIVSLKHKALENLARHEVGVTLLNVMIKGVNDTEIHDIIRLAHTYANIRSITVQTMTFTGQGGATFAPRERMTLDGAAAIIAERSGRDIRKDHFFPLPSNHPLCYSIGYFFKHRDRLTSFTELLPVPRLLELIGPNYLIRPDEKLQDALQEAIALNWAEGRHPELLSMIKGMLKTMYPKDRQLTLFQRQRIAEESILTIYIHAHMDEENFDLSRIVCCTDLVPVEGERLIPACAYNLFYRMKDERFWKESSDE